MFHILSIFIKYTKSMQSFSPALFLKNGHIQTIYPFIFRKKKTFSYTQRTRIDTPDFDFLDIDFADSQSDSLVLVLHGLESHSHSMNIMHLVHALQSNKTDIAVLNFRGCSGETNNVYKSYHSGISDDLITTIDYLISTQKWKSIYVVGYSLGGNVLLKTIGLYPYIQIKKAIAVSVPMHLESCAHLLAKPSRKPYMKRFIYSFIKKMALKKTFLDERSIDFNDIKSVKNFMDIDSMYTAPSHGYNSAEEYWEHNSALYYLDSIIIPTLIINAKDDPFLSEHCFPAISNKHISTLYPKHGGHLGFTESYLQNGTFWHEQMICSFLFDT
jgi:uncharacterized protein